MTKIIICSRLNSRRLPKKALMEINGVPVLEHLISRLEKTGIQVLLAVPPNEIAEFMPLTDKFPYLGLWAGYPDDPLARMMYVAEKTQTDTIIRVTQDKIFLDPWLILKALDTFKTQNLDYLFSSHFTDGTGFEVISYKALKEASQRFDGVEHISYAIRAVTDNKLDFDVPDWARSDHRLLLDYPDDVNVLETVLSSLGNDCSMDDVIKFMNDNQWLSHSNRMPAVTVYTCAYNAEKWIEKTMGSVAEQAFFKHCEYVIVDDFSTDKTPYLISKFASKYKNVRWIRNKSNLGLASSSNVALNNARGKYIIRLDADDYFASNSSLNEILTTIVDRKLDVIYPNYYDGSLDAIGNGKDNHHPAGAIFSTRALNNVKFTDGLKGYDGKDLYLRAKDLLRIGYLNKPIFFYRKHDKSLSVTNMEYRRQLNKKLNSGVTGEALL